MMKKRSIGILIIVAALGLLFGYEFGAKRSNGSLHESVSGTTAHYSMNVVVSGVPFWNDTRASWEAIGKANPNTVTVFGGPTDSDAQKQIDDIETALHAKTVDGLVVAPADSAALTKVINEAMDQGVPVVTYLVDSPNSKRLTYVASELGTASRRVADTVTKGSPAGKAVVLFAKSGNEEQDARRNGFQDFIANNKHMQFVGAYQDNYDERQGAELIKSILVKHPDVKYIFGSNSRSAVGAIVALREMGYKPGQVTVTGWDTDKDVLDLVQNGWVQATVAQQSTFMTSLIFGILDASHKGYLYPVGRSYKENNIRPLPDQIIVPVAIVTPNNVRGFYPKDK